MKTFVIADDITGAAEMAGIALCFGIEVKFTTSIESIDQGDAICILAADTRSSDRSTAVAVTDRIVEKLRSTADRWRIFKKVDSVLRGHITDELGALMKLGYDRALILPANPSKGRIIDRGVYTIDGVPLEETLFADDPEYPATSSRVTEMIEGVEYATRSTEQLCEGLSIGEVRSEEEIDSYIDRFDDNQTLIAGGADTFKSFLRHTGYTLSPTVPFGGFDHKKVVVVLGSTARHNIFEQPFFTHNSVYVSDMPAAVFNGGDPSEWIDDAVDQYMWSGSLLVRIPQQTVRCRRTAQRLRETMAEIVARSIAARRPDELIVEGGSTAYAILKRLGWHDFDVTEQIAEGVVRLCHRRTGVHVTFKPGSYPWGTTFDYPDARSLEQQAVDVTDAALS